MKLDYSIDPTTRDILFHGRISDAEMLNERIAVAIGQEIVRQVAEVIVLEKSAEIMSRVDVNAVANMVMARAAAEVSAKLSERLK